MHGFWLFTPILSQRAVDVSLADGIVQAPSVGLSGWDLGCGSLVRGCSGY